MTEPLDWNHSLAEIGERLSRERNATEPERAALAAALRIVEVPELAVRYEIRKRSGGQYDLRGSLDGEAVQECVVTFAPVRETISDRIDAEFRPEETIPQSDPGEIEASQAPDIEPIEGDAIDVGRVVFETLATSLNPYPRAPDASFEWSDPKGEPDNPFAALEALRRKP